MRSRSAEAKHVLHRVESGRLTDDPARGPHGAPCVSVPAVGAVGELQPFPQGSEGHGVLTDHVARALGEHGDLLARPFAGQSLTTVDGYLVEVASERLGHHLGHAEGGAAGRILLEAVMDLADLDVVIVAE